MDLEVSEPWLLWVLPSVSSCPFPEPLLWGPVEDGERVLLGSPAVPDSSGKLWGAGDGAFPLIRVINTSPGLAERPAAGLCHWT